MQQLPPPRIAALHDLSCIGRCALTVILPTLSVMGYQTVPVPTALLSSHTGGFDHLYFRDLTEDMHGIGAHFRRLGLSFRAIYTGFLGSEAQIQTVKSFIEDFKSLRDESGVCPLVMVDPVMGDDGVLYSTYTPALAEGMRELCHYAQVLTPNLTEACLLSDTPYRSTEGMSDTECEAFIHGLLARLEAFGAERIVITGIERPGGYVENFGRDKDGLGFRVSRPHLNASYPGTGDLFASVLLGRLLEGMDFSAAVEDASDFVGRVISASALIPTPVRMGVALEPQLKYLIVKGE